jgi:hypothetical protein
MALTSKTAPPAPMRIGEVAQLTGTTPRTIRYYEEIGLLGKTNDRVQGKHRSYAAADVERIQEIVRLRDLLGLAPRSAASTARLRIRIAAVSCSTKRRIISIPSWSWSAAASPS